MVAGIAWRHMVGLRLKYLFVVLFLFINMALMQLVAYGCSGNYTVGNTGNPQCFNIRDSSMYYFVDREDGLPTSQDLDGDSTMGMLACPLDFEEWYKDQPRGGFTREGQPSFVAIQHSPFISLPYNVKCEKMS